MKETKDLLDKYNVLDNADKYSSCMHHAVTDIKLISTKWYQPFHMIDTNDHYYLYLDVESQLRQENIY